MVRTSNDKIQRAIDLFEKHNIPYRLKLTNQRVELKSKFASYSNKESELPAHELHFIKKVRDSIIETGLYESVPKRFKDEATKKKRIHYFSVANRYKKEDQLENCVEIDLRSAYWETAYRMGLLSEDIYQQGKTISKQSRLAAIGSLAKVERNIVFDGKKRWEEPPTKSEKTEHIWDEICWKVGRLVSRAAKEAGKGFVFFWVDAMFIHRSALPAVKKIIKQAGYDFSIEETKWIKFSWSKIIVKGKGKWIYVDGRRVWKDTRPFPFSIEKRSIQGRSTPSATVSMNTNEWMRSHWDHIWKGERPFPFS